MPSDLLRYHQWCISDPVLMPAYESAIRLLVKPGDTVFDLGAGTGILAMLACAAGAAEVHAVDPSEIIAAVPELAAANGFGDRITVHQMLSYDFDPEQRADVVILSMHGTAGVGNDLLKVVVDARERLLKPGGVMIPLSIQPSFAPVETPDWYSSAIDCWDKDRLGLSFHALRQYAVNRSQSFNVGPEALLARPRDFRELAFSTISSATAACEMSFEIERPGVVHALAGWVTIAAAPGIQCSSSPLEEHRMPWDYLALALDRPIRVNTGDRLQAKIQLNVVGRQSVAQWDVSACAQKTMKHSTFRGMLLEPGKLSQIVDGSGG